MKKGRSYEQNPIQNFEIEQQFEQLMQIQGLSSNKEQQKELFPSIKHLFHSNTTVNIVGQGPNANVRSFYYLLLCHIRKEHFKRLINEMREKQLREIEGDDSMINLRDRKVSFNGKGAIFLNGPQYQNYGLHKLRMFIFSKSVDLMDIQNTPFQKDERLLYRGQKLSSPMLKKLFSQFLKELLPAELTKNYKNQIRSIRSYLNQHMCIGVILTILMRHILLSRYEVQSARNFQEEINDHTVCTTLCDAFAIDGLICKDNLYEINTWCKVYSLDYCSNKTFFIEMFNDEFEEMGSANDKKVSSKIVRQNEEKTKITQNAEQKEQKELLRYPSSKMSLPKSERSGPIIKSKGSSSMMDADADSQVSDETGRKSKKTGMKFRGAESGQQSNSQVHSQFNSSICRSIAKDNRQCTSQMNGRTRNGRQESSGLKAQNNCEPSTNNELMQLQDHSKKDENEGNSQVNREENIILKDNTSIVQQNNLLISDDRICQQQVDNNTSCTKKRNQYRDNFDGEHTPSDFFQKLNIVYDKNNFKVKIGYRSDRQIQPQPNIVNNNINNNIYLNFGANDNKTYIPVINISTAKDLKTTMDPNSYIKINLS